MDLGAFWEFMGSFTQRRRSGFSIHGLTLMSGIFRILLMDLFLLGAAVTFAIAANASNWKITSEISCIPVCACTCVGVSMVVNVIFPVFSL